jgi:hypothetical protein
LWIDLAGAGRFTGPVRVLLPVVLLLALLVWGCAREKLILPPAANASVVRSGNQRLIVTPETALVGRVVKVNSAGRFVVLNYPVGRLPALEQRLSLYRQGLKVGEVRIAGPQYDDNIVADVVEGEAALGDAARSQ